MFFNRSYNYNDVLTRASITLQVIEDVAIYKAQLFSSNGNIFSSRDESSDLHVRVFKGFEDITDRFTDIIWKRFTADSGSVEEDAKWGEQHKGKKDIVITKEDIQSKANIQVEVYGLIQGKRSLVATDFITFIDVNDMEGSPTPPSNPKDGDLWLDTSVMPPRLMVWDSSLGMWVEVTVAGNDRRNLIRHSNFYKKNFDLWTAVNAPTLTVESLSGKKWARIKSTSVKNAYCGISQITNATAKAQYSFQMLSEVYIQSAYPNGNAVAAFYSINESNVKTLIKEEKFDLTTDEKVFTTTLTSLVDTKKIEVVISGQKDAQFDFVVTNIKLENHPIPTAWELAIEDMQDALDQKVGNTSEEVFDSLTDNGKMQGLYVDIDEHGNKNFYFKGQFIDAKNLRVMNNNGTRTLYINENGNIEIVASSFTLVAGADTNVPTKDEVKNDIDNIQIGANNLLYKTNSSLRIVGANKENQVVNIGSIKGNELAGKQVTFQFKYKVISETISGTYRPQTGMSSWIPLSGKFETLKKEGEYFYYTNTIPVADKGFTNVEIRFENMQGEIEIYERKLELGNKATGWSKAQEDIDAEIEKAKADAATANQNASNAQDSANQANNKVNEMSNDNKLTSIEKQSAKLEWDVIAVEKPKIEAEAVKFSVDKTDYVAKYNTLANYLSPLLANLSVTSDIVGDTFRTNFKNYYDARQTLLNAISSKAKEIADNANNKIDNLEIGGQNILPMTKDFSSGWWLGVGGVEAGVTSDVKSIVNKRTNYVEGQPRQQIVYTYKPIVTKGTKFTISGYYYIDTSVPLNGDAGNNNIVLREYEVGSDKMRDFCVTNFDTSKVNQWVYFSATGVTNFNQTRDLAFMFSIHKNGYVKLSKPKMEFGNVATDWSQALGDFDIIIAEADKKAQEALNNLTDLANDNKLTPNEKQQTKKDWDIILGEYPKIIAEANKSGVSTTNYTNSYNTLKNYIEPILSNLTTTTDITGVAFRNNFKSYYDNRQDVLNAISTALKANADNANNKIDGLQIGTRNFLLNTGLRVNTENFAYNSAKVSLETTKKTFNNNNCFYFDSTGETTDRWFWAAQYYYNMIIGKEYNFSCNVFIPTNHGIDRGASVEVICYNASEARTLTQNVPINLTKLDTWQTITMKLTIPTNTVKMQCGPYIVRNGKMYAGDYKLEEGNRPTGWSAAPEDTQSDIDNKVDVGGSIDDINQSPSGQIDFPKLNIKGAISFEALDSEMGKNFIAKKDSQGNRIQTVINGGAIETSSVTADKMSMYNLNVIRRELVNGVWQERDTSFAITDEGKIRASGTFSSFNYRDDIDISKSEGWMINENGDSVFNSSIVRGRVELPNAGITDYGGGTVYNILQDTDFRLLQEKTDIGWDNALNGTYNLYWWGGYNSGVPDPTHGYHTRVDTTTFPFNTLLFRNKNSEIGQKNRWLGVNGSIPANTLKANTKYAFSIDIYFTAVGQKIYGGLYHKLTDNNTSNFNSGQYTFISTAEHVNKWVRFSWICTTNAKLSTTNSSNWYIYGYGGTEGDVFVNKVKLEEGEVPTPYASTAEVAKKEVRIYAGAGYYDRYNAPFRVLQDGSVIATKGEFSGTVTGKLEIGNISIYDDLTTPGVIEIKNNDNSKTVVRIGEEYSEFNSDVYIGAKTNYLFRTNISGKQLVSGKQSSIRFEYEENNSGDILSNSLTLNGKKIQFNETEYISSTSQGVINIGTEASKGILNIKSTHDSELDGVFGEMHVNVVGTASLSNALKIGNVDLMPIYPEGLDIFVN